MQSPSHLRGWGSHLRQEEGQGHQSNGGRGEAGGQKQRSPGRALGKQGVGVGDPGACSPALPAVYPASRGGGGERDKNPNRAAPARSSAADRPLPRPPQPPPAPAAGVHGRPSLPPPPPQSFCPGSGVSTARPEPPPASHCPPPRPHALTRPSLDGPPSPSPAAACVPTPGQAAPAATRAGGRGGFGYPRARLLSPLALRGKLPGSRWRPPPRNPRTWTRARRGGRGGGRRPPPSPRPARRAHLSCRGPAAPPRLTHAGATVAQCLSKLLISPGAARRRRRLGPAGEVELPGPRPRNTCCCRRRRGHTQAQRRPLPGHWLAPGSLTSASGRCRVSAANTRARARTGARVHPRGHRPLPGRSAR